MFKDIKVIYPECFKGKNKRPTKGKAMPRPISVHRQWMHAAFAKLQKAAQAERERDPIAANFFRSGASYCYRQAAKHCESV